MVMSITEASAAQKVLDLTAGHIREMRQAGTTADTVVVIDEYGVTLTLDQVMAAGRVLAEQSYRKLYVGMDGDRWDKLINPTLDGDQDG